MTAEAIQDRARPVLPPFVKVDEDADTIDMWVVEPTGDPIFDEAVGFYYAGEAVAYARVIADPSFVAAVVAELAVRPVVGARDIERGFLNRIARLACAGSLS